MSCSSRWPDEQGPDEQIKFFETTSPVILTAWFVDLQTTSDIHGYLKDNGRQNSNTKDLSQVCGAFYGMMVGEKKSSYSMAYWRKGKAVIKIYQHLEIAWIRVDLSLPPSPQY